MLNCNLRDRLVCEVKSILQRVREETSYQYKSSYCLINTDLTQSKAHLGILKLYPTAIKVVVGSQEEEIK